MMNDLDIRILYGKLAAMEIELEDLRRAVDRLEEWIVGMKGMLKEYPVWTMAPACCASPPGDGSTCAGGSCCCAEDYKCDLCKLRESKNSEV